MPSGSDFVVLTLNCAGRRSARFRSRVRLGFDFSNWGLARWRALYQYTSIRELMCGFRKHSRMCSWPSIMQNGPRRPGWKVFRRWRRYAEDPAVIGSAVGCQDEIGLELFNELFDKLVIHASHKLVLIEPLGINASAVLKVRALSHHVSLLLICRAVRFTSLRR